MKTLGVLTLILICGLMLPACKKEAAAPVDPFQRGKTVYMSRCIACHNINPREVGSLGSAVFGSSRELLEARVLRGEYPPGYAPKKNSKLMPPMPELASDIEALHTFLNEVK